MDDAGLQSYLNSALCQDILNRCPRAHKGFATYALADAYNRRNNAAFAGSHGDGGCAEIVRELTIWIDGQNGTAPSTGTLAVVNQQFIRDNDPDYQTYLELKKKFE